MDQLTLLELDAALCTPFDVFLMMVHHTINPSVPYHDNWHIDSAMNRTIASLCW